MAKHELAARIDEQQAVDASTPNSQIAHVRDQRDGGKPSVHPDGVMNVRGSGEPDRYARSG